MSADDSPDCSESPREKRKLPGSHSERSFEGEQRTIRQKLLAKVKSWSGRDATKSLVKMASEQVVDQTVTNTTPLESGTQFRPKLRKSPKSMPALGGTSKLMFWDAYDRKGRGNRKGARKKGKSIPSPKNDADDPEEGTAEDIGEMEEEDLRKYSYVPRSTKSVVFTDEVLVVYFKNELVVGEATEPLKKETEQQMRNKEMRRCHLVKNQDKYNLCLF